MSAPDQAYALWRAVDGRLAARPDPAWLQEEADRLRSARDRLLRAHIAKGHRVAEDPGVETRCEIDDEQRVGYVFGLRVAEDSLASLASPVSGRVVEARLGQAVKLRDVAATYDGGEFAVRVVLGSTKPRPPPPAARARARPAALARPMKGGRRPAAPPKSLRDRLTAWYTGSSANYLEQYGERAFTLFNVDVE